MAELVWKGKSRGRARLLSARSAPVLRSEELYGPEVAGEPRNRLVLGDRVPALRGLLGEFAGKVALVYIDPPFDTGQDFHYLATIPGAPAVARTAAARARKERGAPGATSGWTPRSST